MPSTHPNESSAVHHFVTWPHYHVRHLVATIRLGLGWIFAWAFLDKTFGLGFATIREDAWINGGSPTYGFLTFGTSGPLAEAFQAMAGNVFVDWIFMLGLLGIGLALLFGIGIRIAAVSGALMLVLMWAAAPTPANNPFMDDHILYALVLLALPPLRAGNTWGLGRWWSEREIVQRHRWLE